MKHIKKNNIVAVSASTENTSFPVSQLLDSYPSRKYKASSGEWVTVLTLFVVGGCTDLMIAGTNVANATISVKDPGVMTFGDSMEFGDSVEWGNVELSVTGTTTQDSENNALFITLSERVGVPCVVTLTLTGPSSETVEAGVITANLAETYGGRNPKYGLSKSQIDYSIKAQNSNGSRYYKKGDIVRTFSLSALMLRSDTRKLESFFKDQGEEPTAWKLTDENSNDYVVFARMDGPPAITDSYPNHSDVNWNLVEVL